MPTPRRSTTTLAALIGIAAPLALVSGVAHAAPGAEVPVTTIDFDQLSQGATPGQPWYLSGVLHGPEGETSYDGTEVSIDNFGGLDDGSYLIRGEDNGDGDYGKILHVDDGGIPQVYDEGPMASQVVIDDNGQNAAWVRWSVDNAGQPTASTAVYADASTGKVLSTVPVDAVVEPTEFVNGRVILESTDGGRDALRWAPGSTPEEWKGTRSTPASSVESGLTARTVAKTGDDGQPCAQVLDTSKPSDRDEVLWESCDLVVEQFSPDGRYAAAIDTRTDGLGASGYTIVEARTGTPVRRIDTDLTRRITVEDDGSFVFDARDRNPERGPTALVRCPVEGDCELATEPVEYPENPEAWPYLLSEHH